MTEEKQQAQTFVEVDSDLFEKPIGRIAMRRGPEVGITGKRMQSICPDCSLRRVRRHVRYGPLKKSECPPDLAEHTGSVNLDHPFWFSATFLEQIRRLFVTPEKSHDCLLEGESHDCPLEVGWYECNTLFWCKNCKKLTPIIGMHYIRQFSPLKEFEFWVCDRIRHPFSHYNIALGTRIAHFFC